MEKNEMNKELEREGQNPTSENALLDSASTRIESEDSTVVTELKQEDHLGISMLQSWHYAGFWMRFWAYSLDLIVIGSLNRLFIYPVLRFFDIPISDSGLFQPVTIVTAFVFYLYFVLMTKFMGQTLGKMVFGLKVVDIDGKPLTWSTVVFREWIGRFISATIMVLYIIVAFTPKKQGLHDLFADTSVIHVQNK